MGGGSLNPVKKVKKAWKKTKETLSSGAKEVRRAGRDIDQELGLTEDIKDPFGEVKKYGKKWDSYVSERSPAKKMFDKMTPDIPDMTQPKDPYIAPDPEAIAQSRRRRRRGGASTIMTSGSDTLGG